MSNQPKPQDILNSIGAMAEMTDVFYKQLSSVSNRRILENYY